MLQAGHQPSTTSIRQPGAAGGDAGPGWILFSVLAALGLVDSIVMLVTDSMGLSIGLGLNKTIVASFKGLALSASASSEVYFMLASLAAQLGIIGLFVLFAYLVRHRSVRSYMIGIVVYAFDALPAVANKDIATANVHLLGLLGLITGLVELRGMPQVVREPEHDDSTDRSESIGKRLRWRAGWAAAGCGGVLITTVNLTAVGVFAGMVNPDSRAYFADMEQRILHRAPADLSEAEREQLHRAMTELAELEGLGHVNLAIDSEIRRALTLAVAGEKVGREDILHVIQVVGKASERAERRRSQEDPAPAPSKLPVEP
jgi:hypothetical protein